MRPLSKAATLPRRLVPLAGSDAMAAVEANLRTVQAQIDAHRALSAALAIAIT